MNILTFSEIEKTPYTKIIITNTCPYHTHTFFEFVVCLDGSFTNIINNTNVNIVRGTVLLLRPQDKHHFINGEKHTHRDIYVMPEKMKAICDSIDRELYSKLAQEPLSVNFNLSEYDLRYLETKLNFFNNVHGKPSLAVRAAHTDVISEILHLWQQSYLKGRADYPKWLYTLLDNLSTEEFLVKNISEIAESTHYSHGFVCREFKKHVGSTLKEYVSELKFSYAQALLSDNNASIASVAERLNYGSTSNFIIAFKKRHGISPAQWRKNRQ